MITDICIQYLYLDLEKCTRCQESEEHLSLAVKKLKEIFPHINYSVELIHIDSIDRALEHQFKSSPTIRINGHDLPVKLVETKCEPCGDLAGTDVDCRAWEYNGDLFDSVPIQMIIELVSIYLKSGPTITDASKVVYKLPENIKDFFNSTNTNECCSPTKCKCC